jgi:heat shock protein HslJ
MTQTSPVRPSRRRRSFAAVALAVAGLAILVAACSSSGGLTGKTWQLTAITEKVPAFQGVVPSADQPNYTIAFNEDATATIQADCNSVTANYTTTSDGAMTITLGASTMMACPEGSMADQYMAGLSATKSYAVDGDQLTLTLADEGTLAFAAAK